MRPRRHVAILGATATGKTALAIDVAETLRCSVKASLKSSVSPRDLEILSFDSVQFYRELAIGSARPSDEQLRRVKHHFVAQQSVLEEMTAGRFASEAQELMAKASASVEFIIVGGSGFYWQALERGVPNVPASTPASRAQIEAHVAAMGLEAAYAELLLRDAETAKRIHPHDQYRIVRALEILATLPEQETWSALRARHERAEPQITLRAKVGLELSREDLERQVAQRTSQMLAQGLLTEVRDLLAQGVSEAGPLASVGYREAVLALREGWSESQLHEAICQSTLRLAKKQRTWFQRDPEIQWFDAKRDMPRAREVLLKAFA